MRSRTLVHVALLAAALSAAAGCVQTLAFSDNAPIVVLGHPPPPPPPPPAPVAAAAPAPAAPARVEVQQDQIVIHDKIQFETNSAAIKPESIGLMDEITAVVRDNPQITRLSIEGHTDSTGSEQHNLQLSERRAAAVRSYLVEHGIAADRLVAKGWGESRPIADNATEEGREQNRRVEFLILDQSVSKRTYEIDPKTGERREVKPQPPVAASPTEPSPATAPAVTPGATP